MEKYIIAGREYDVKEREPVHNLPIVDIPMMSDERWNQLCREHIGELSEILRQGRSSRL